jgi:hypothetical protein
MGRSPWKSSLLCLQQPTAGPQPAPDKSSPHLSILNLQNEYKTLLCNDNFEPVNGGNVWGYTCLANFLLL